MSTSAQSLELKEKGVVSWLFSVFSEERSGISSPLLCLLGVPRGCGHYRGWRRAALPIGKENTAACAAHSYLVWGQTDTGGMWKNRLEQKVLVRRCKPIVFTPSPCSVRLTTGRGWGEVSVLLSPPVPKMNSDPLKTGNWNLRLEYVFQELLMFWKFTSPSLVPSGVSWEVREEKKYLEGPAVISGRRIWIQNTLR